MSAEKIKIIYQESKSSYSANFILPIVFILLILSVFGYLYANIQRKLMHMSWSEQKCNPRFLFFSGFLDPMNKNPWVTTQDNFQKCVSTNIYKDPALSRVIKHNEDLIQKHENEIKQNLEVGKKYVNAMNNEWNSIKDKQDQNLMDVQTTNESIFEKNDVLYEEILLKTSQMFHLLSSIIRYIQGILVYKVTSYKKNLSIDQQHEYFMGRYIQIYENYSKAYNLVTKDNNAAINHARIAIEDYTALNKELDDFMSVHMKDITSITEICYQLEYNMDDRTCSTLFRDKTVEDTSHINQDWIDHYPMMKHALKL
jgi:hypothetical protein